MKRVTVRVRVVFAVTPLYVYDPDASALSAAGTSLPPSFLVSTLLHPMEGEMRPSGLSRIIRNQLNVTRARVYTKVNRCLHLFI